MLHLGGWNHERVSPPDAADIGWEMVDDFVYHVTSPDPCLVVAKRQQSQPRLVFHEAEGEVRADGFEDSGEGGDAHSLLFRHGADVGDHDCSQDTNDGDDDEQLHKGECRAELVVFHGWSWFDLSPTLLP